MSLRKLGWPEFWLLAHEKMPTFVVNRPGLPGIEGFPRTWDLIVKSRKVLGKLEGVGHLNLGSQIHDVSLRGQVTE